MKMPLNTYSPVIYCHFEIFFKIKIVYIYAERLREFKREIKLRVVDRVIKVSV